MSEEKKGIAPDGVENWARWLESLRPSTPMTDDGSRCFVSCSMNEDAMESDIELDKLLTIGERNLPSMFYNRVKSCHTYTITKAVALFMGAYVVENPGGSTMYANYLQYQAWKRGIKHIDMAQLSNIFTYGFFMSSQMREAWERQKIDRDSAEGLASDNLLDYYDAQKSIKDIIEA